MRLLVRGLASQSRVLMRFIPRRGKNHRLRTKWGKFGYQHTCFCGVSLPSTCSPSHLFISKFLVRIFSKIQQKCHTAAGRLGKTVTLLKVLMIFLFLMHFTPVNLNILNTEADSFNNSLFTQNCNLFTANKQTRIGFIVNYCFAFKNVDFNLELVDK